MAASSLLFRDLAYIFAAAVAGGLIARRLRQPLILGYVAGGILISPFTPGPTVSDLHSLELFAEIGVIFLMFSIGIEFSIRELVRVRWVALFGGPLGIFASMALGVLGARGPHCCSHGLGLQARGRGRSHHLCREHDGSGAFVDG
jgi:monovalent cation:H+ antiporter-2, CPA2 family